MEKDGRGRLIAGALVAAAAVGVALTAGHAAWAGFAGLIGGALAVLIAWRPYFFPERPQALQAAPADPLAWAREIMGSLSEPMLLLSGGRVAAANPAALALLGEWIEGHDVRLALRHPAGVERLSARQAGKVDEVELVGIGSPDRRWLMSVAALKDGFRLVHLSDRSAVLAAEQMRVDFVANASHELRTPLATLLGFIETLGDDEAAEDKALRTRFLGIMHEEGKRMQQLIEDLMSLSRIEADRFRPPREPVDLVPLVDEVRAGCAQLLEERGNQVRLTVESRSTVVPGDRGQLLQLLRNLVVNAVKYGARGEEVGVAIVDEGEATVRLTVSDRGEGIAPEHLPRLTERFYRVDAGRSRAEGGTGLGLAIVKHIVGRHRGRLEIKSAPGEGTQVHVLLPRLAEPLS
jgi:two-component system phosphate regulon sensor histidine kinase PhoR